MAILYMLRHGESMWNVQNRFTGWVNVPLTEKGMDEAIFAGKKLAGLNMHAVVCSGLMRAQQTALLVLAQSTHQRCPQFVTNWDQVFDDMMLPVLVSEAYNERHYGDLQGLNKQDTIERFGADQVQQWRRGFDVTPPNGESLADTCVRTHAAFDRDILPLLQNERHVLLVAHGNTIRSLMMKLENIDPEHIQSVECKTGDIVSYTTLDGKAFARNEELR